MSLRRLLFVPFVLTCSLVPILCATRPVQRNTETVFEGSSPCGDFAKPFLKISDTIPCEFMKWLITFYTDEQSSSPTQFNIRIGYGLTQANTQGFLDGGHQANFQGKWSIIKKKSGGHDSTFYKLVNAEGATLTFLKLNEELLHPIDAEGRLMIGNAAWNYTLSRKDK